jgi:hypothetical protein
VSLDADQYAISHDPEPITWNLPIMHWSPSSLSMLQRCPRQWQERYIFGRKERPAEALFTGTVVHATFEHNFRQKIDSHEDIAIVDLLDWYGEDAFPRLLLEEQEKAGQDIFWESSPDEARARGRVLITEYQSSVAPRIQPVDVELKIAADFGAPVPVEGRFDVDRASSVIDFKTGRMAVKEPKEAWRIQAAVYAHAQQKPVEFHTLSATKGGKVTVLTPLESEALLVHPTRQEREHQARTIRALSDYACFLMATIGPEEPWPTMGVFHSWACNYCGYRPACPAWSST